MNTVDRYRRRPGAQATLRTVLIPLNLILGTGQIQGLLQYCPGQTKPFTVAAQDKVIILPSFSFEAGVDGRRMPFLVSKSVGSILHTSWVSMLLFHIS